LGMQLSSFCLPPSAFHDENICLLLRAGAFLAFVFGLYSDWIGLRGHLQADEIT